MTSPFVAEVLATWLEANNNLAPEDIREIKKKQPLTIHLPGIYVNGVVTLGDMAKLTHGQESKKLYL